MAHHGQEFGLGVVGTLGLFARLDELRNGLLLLVAGHFQALGQVVDVLGQVAQFGIVDDGQWRLEVALLNGLDRLAHFADRLGQAQGQAPRQPIGERQGEQREDGGLEQDFLLALVERIIGHADDHAPQVVLGGVLRSRGGFWQKVAVEVDPLQADGRLEYFHQLRSGFGFTRLLDIHQDMVGIVLHFQEAHMGYG
ncbi:hypothetical protein D9M71_168460 [compost metagenome]